MYFIKCDTFRGALITTSLGLFASIWTNCIFLLIFPQNKYDIYRSQAAEHLVQNTLSQQFYLICAISIGMLIWGLKKSYKKYMIPWVCLKLCECIVILIGSLNLILKEHRLYGIAAIGYAVIALNIYISLCIYKSYQNMIRRFPRQKTKIEKTTGHLNKVLGEQEIKLNLEEEDCKLVKNNSYLAPVHNV